MFLKRLDISGFKSFAERTEIEFVQGVTAVVGPNGSGKSNITEAIRWVLGEQSAKSLRGSKMEDIIFAGSEGKKALNVAEVTLTLDNQKQFLPLDYNEVSVTRRVYRTGESEYYINKQACRLKDVIDLFMDSGIGRESLSIIGQGKIEQVLSSKAEEKRRIIEEAAGVLKYKHRKQKAEDKLSETEANLNRIEDILYELESQIEPLKIQAAMAKDYLEKKEQLKTIEVALLAYEIKVAHEKYESQQETIEKLKRKEVEKTSVIQQLETKLAALRLEMQKCDDEIEHQQHLLLTASEELEKLEGKKQVLRERQSNRQFKQEELVQLIVNYQEKRNAFQQQIRQEEKRLQEQKKELSALQEKLQQESKNLADTEMEYHAKIEERKADYIDLLNKQAATKNDIRYLQEQIEQHLHKSERLNTETEKYEKQKLEILTEKQIAKENRNKEKNKLKHYLSMFHELKEQLRKEEDERHLLEKKRLERNQSIQQYESRKAVLEEMQEDYSGFFQGVKEILKSRHTLSGIIGAVAELIAVPKELELAIETALGGAMQHLVVETEEDARQAIAFLKKGKRGKATFLPLTVIKGRFLSNDERKTIEQHPKFIGIAEQLVRYDPTYRNVMAYLLGQIIVAEDLKSANEIARLLNHRVRIVTLDGDVVNPGGSMSGGSAKQKNNTLLGRQRELESLSKKLAQLKHDMKTLEQQMEEKQTIVLELKEKLETIREEGEQIRLQEQALERDVKEMDMKEQNIVERLTHVEREKAAIDQEVEHLRRNKKIAEEALQNIQRQAIEMEKEINVLTEKMKKEQSSKEERKEAMTALKIDVARKKQTVDHLEESLERISKEVDENNRSLQAAEKTLHRLREETAARREEEKALEQAIDMKRKEKETTASLIAKRRQTRFDLQQRMEQLEKDVNEHKKQDKQLSETLKKEELMLNRYDMELESNLQKLQEEYEITYERAREKYSLTLDPNEAKARIKQIKRAIVDLGTVNLGAIEEFKRVDERHRFLFEQRDDLLRAKETLNQVITEMDDVVKKRFKDTFEQVRQHFQVIFQELFGGGHADLKLVNPEDLLETGVDILAQPPGKKLQHLNLLSGGERALTAIVLLFSILKARPVPFCVLDEIEAALDDANVARFADYLRKFSNDTQFIVVTHRKGTMERADALYGVTMQRSGISRLVSVKLEETASLEQTVS